MFWPEDLVRDIAMRRAVLFFGAGVSMNSVAKDGVTRPKGWVEFLNLAVAGLGKLSAKKKAEIKRLIRQNDLLTACGVIRHEMGRDPFIQLIKDQFQVPGFKPALIHDSLWKLDLRISITPNFDNIYDTVVAQRGDGTVTLKSYSDSDVADALRRHEHVVIKSGSSRLSVGNFGSF